MKDIKIQIKNYNNKSRKGEYIYIKDEKKKVTILKKRENVPMSLYMLYHKDKTEKRRKLKSKSFKGYVKNYGKKGLTKTKIRRGLSKYYKSDKKAIHREFRKGISQAEIKDVLNTSYDIVRRKIKELLEPLVLDKGLINILTQESNLEKLKFRMSYKAEVISNNGRKICEINSIGNLKPSELIDILKKDFGKNKYIKYSDADNMPNVARKIGLQMVKFQEDGKVGRVNLKMWFTKDTQRGLIGV